MYYFLNRTGVGRFTCSFRRRERCFVVVVLLVVFRAVPEPGSVEMWEFGWKPDAYVL